MRYTGDCILVKCLLLTWFLWIAVHHTTTTVLRPFFWDHLGEPVPEEYFWTLWCKGRLTEADTPTIRLGATPSGLTSAHHHPPIFTDRMPFLPLSQQCQSTEGKWIAPQPTKLLFCLLSDTQQMFYLIT